MERTSIVPDLNTIPSVYRGLFAYPVWDSSCSPLARVYYLEAEGGVYLKSSAAGSLRTEAEMTRFYHTKRIAGTVLGAEVLDYRTENGADWLLTSRVPGEDCTQKEILAEPEKLSGWMGEILRILHSADTAGCPVPRRTDSYLAAVEEGARAGRFDCSYYSDFYGEITAEEALSLVRSNAALLQTDVLLHGDFCLPNIMQQGGCFSGFVDVGNGGAGDRHIDLYWGIWTLKFNLKTDRYGERFLDAYGREDVQPELLRVIAAAETFG